MCGGISFQRCKGKLLIDSIPQFLWNDLPPGAAGEQEQDQEGQANGAIAQTVWTYP